MTYCPVNISEIHPEADQKGFDLFGACFSAALRRRSVLLPPVSGVWKKQEGDAWWGFGFGVTNFSTEGVNRASDA
jgi:hypothetical protein